LHEEIKQARSMSVYNFTESHGVSDTTRLEDEADAWDTDPDFVVKLL